jgi:diphthamide synthase (EF-2-diphthine--ammonia ligase)
MPCNACSTLVGPGLSSRVLRHPPLAQARHPEVEAVASGAIASDYQRLRVEDVCRRLGLVSLAYLWHRPQEELLE